MPYTILKSLVVLVFLLWAVGLFSRRINHNLLRNLRRGQPSGPFQNWAERIRGLAVFVGGQYRLFRRLLPGISHFIVFWGFLVLSLTILQAIAEGLLSFTGTSWVLPIVGEWGPLALLQDLFAVLVVAAVLFDLVQRVVVRPPRYDGSHKAQAVTVLGFILAIMISLVIMNGIHINLGKIGAVSWRPVSEVVGSMFAGLNPSTQTLLAETAYWIHLGVVLLFLTELPEGKHFHVVTSLPAVLLRDLEPAGRLRPAPEFGENIGVGAVNEFRWREMMDFFTCTECGRCQDACPAFASSAMLSPKLLMMGLRDRLKDEGEGDSLFSGAISEDAVWACTSCLACDQECPLFIERVRLIVDLRRRLVIDGRLDTELQNAFANLSRYGNSFGQSERARARWSQPLEPKLKDIRRQPARYLWFVGDYASYSPALADVTTKTAQVLQGAGVDVGILYDSERNSGNDVRRAGEEGLFELLLERNTSAMEKCTFESIITTDPHSYNTLRNEYALNGNGRGARSVLHMAEVFDELLRSGVLKARNRLSHRATFHDPCYLGRYNGIYDAPRRVIEATGCDLVEMPRNRDRAACCGAGGGRIWIKEGQVDERPSEARVREAASLGGVDTLVVACPKDLAMFRDAVKTTGVEDRLVVKDLAELVHEAVH